MNFWDFTYEPNVIETEITTHRETQNMISGAVTVEDITTVQVDVVTNWGEITRLGVILLLTYSVCVVVTKLVTVWKRGR